jgi:hypothetical protein
MFIATAIQTSPQLRRTETGVRHTLRSYGAMKSEPQRFYKHFDPYGINAFTTLTRKREPLADNLNQSSGHTTR